MHVHHVPRSSPGDARCAVLFAEPQLIDPNDHDPIAIGLVDAYDPNDELEDPRSHLQTLRWTCPWVATIHPPPSQAPTQDRLIQALSALPPHQRARAVVFFDGEEDGPAFRWWAPELAAAIQGFERSGQLLGRLMHVCASGARAGTPLRSNALLHGVIAWTLFLSQQPEWETFHTGTFEVLTDDPAYRPRLSFEGGRIVSARAGKESGIEAAKQVLKQESGGLWIHLEPMDEPSFTANFESLI